MDLLLFLRVTREGGDGGGGNVQGEIGEQPGGDTPRHIGVFVFFVPKTPLEGGFGPVLELMDEQEPCRHVTVMDGGDTGTRGQG